ncbi:juxtaposed with another zinc finger protein 1, partial [Phlebotomus papatasi]
MAVFLINICKFNGCGITFPSLGDLIQHIEDTHIDYDPKVIELKEQQQPQCLPLSYVLRFITDAARKEASFVAATGADIKRKLTTKHHSYSASSSNRSNTPTGSELDEEDMIVSESEDSNDSWTTEEFSSEFIMRYGSRHSGNQGSNSLNEKPFACPVPGCKKRYKNVNGIKYHSKNGHKKDGKVRKGYKCHCGKSYKTSQGLKSHTVLAHNTTGNMTVQPPGSMSPTGSNCSNTSGSSNCISQNLNSLNNAIASVGSMLNTSSLNTSNSTVHLSPTSPLPGLSTSCGANNGSNTQLKNSFGLITIKAKPGLVGVTNKLVKIVPENSVSNIDKVVKASDSRTISTSVSATASKISLPGLVNLGILTPATSPKPISQSTSQCSIIQSVTQSQSVSN